MGRVTSRRSQKGGTSMERLSYARRTATPARRFLRDGQPAPHAGTRPGRPSLVRCTPGRWGCPTGLSSLLEEARSGWVVDKERPAVSRRTVLHTRSGPVPGDGTGDGQTPGTSAGTEQYPEGLVT